MALHGMLRRIHYIITNSCRICTVSLSQCVRIRKDVKLPSWYNYRGILYCNCSNVTSQAVEVESKSTVIKPFSLIDEANSPTAVLKVFYKYRYRYGLIDAIASFDKISINFQDKMKATLLTKSDKWALLCEFTKQYLYRCSPYQLIHLLTSLLKIKQRIGESSEACNSLLGQVIRKLERNIELLTINDLLDILELCADTRLNLRTFAQQLFSQVSECLNEEGIDDIVVRCLHVCAHYGGKSLLISRLETWLTDNYHRLSIKQICSVCSSFHRLTRRCTDLRLMLGQRAAELDIHTLAEDDVVSLIRSFTFRPFVVEELFKEVCKYTINNINSLNNFSIARIARSFATLRYYDSGLSNAIEEHMLAQPGDVNGYSIQCIADIMYTFARWNHSPQAVLLSRVTRKLNRYLNRKTDILFTPAITTLWSLIVLNTFPYKAICKILDPNVVEEIDKVGSAAIRAQLYQIDLSVLLQRPEYEVGLKPEYRVRFKRLLTDHVREGSMFQHEVQRVLEQLLGDRRYYWKELVTGHGYTVDIALLLDSEDAVVLPKITVLLSKNKHQHYKRIAIEMDGPHHFIYKSNTLVGESEMKTQLLNGYYWHVVQVPYYEWEELESPDERKHYVKQKIFGDKPVVVVAV